MDFIVATRISALENDGIRGRIIRLCHGIEEIIDADERKILFSQIAEEIRPFSFVICGKTTTESWACIFSYNRHFLLSEEEAKDSKHFILETKEIARNFLKKMAETTDKRLLQVGFHMQGILDEYSFI